MTYEKGLGSTESEDEIVADSDRELGWFWRNRDGAEVTVTVQVRGEHAEFKDAN